MNPRSLDYSTRLDETKFRARFKILFVGYRKMFFFRASLLYGLTPTFPAKIISKRLDDLQVRPLELHWYDIPKDSALVAFL